MATQNERIKWVEGAPFMVDGFNYVNDRCTTYFLTHFHSDHYWGLTRGFSGGIIYCSEVTAALVINKLGVKPQFVHALEMEQTARIGGWEVTPLDANHCPGAVMFLFRNPKTGVTILHTGDFRASAALTAATRAWLNSRGWAIDTLYLDTTYCNPTYSFPPQEEALAVMADIAKKEVARDPSTVFYVGTYSIGKERAVRAVAQAIGTKAYANPSKEKMLRAANQWDDHVFSRDPKGCRVRMAWLGRLRIERFQRSKAAGGDADAEGGDGDDGLVKEEMERSDSVNGAPEKGGAGKDGDGDDDDREEEEEEEQEDLKNVGSGLAVCGFRPTGWSLTRNRKGSNGERVYEPWVNGDARLYFVPYSEHSSFTELQHFVRAIRPKRLIPTVNARDDRRVEKMLKWFLESMDLTGDKSRIDAYVKRGATVSKECASVRVAVKAEASFDLSSVDVEAQAKLWASIVKGSPPQSCASSSTQPCTSSSRQPYVCAVTKEEAGSVKEEGEAAVVAADVECVMVKKTMRRGKKRTRGGRKGGGGGRGYDGGTSVGAGAGGDDGGGGVCRVGCAAGAADSMVGQCVDDDDDDVQVVAVIDAAANDDAVIVHTTGTAAAGVITSTAAIEIDMEASTCNADDDRPPDDNRKRKKGRVGRPPASASLPVQRTLLTSFFSRVNRQ